MRKSNLQRQFGLVNDIVAIVIAAVLLHLELHYQCMDVECYMPARLCLSFDHLNFQ